jgi:hypothetical protein
MSMKLCGPAELVAALPHLLGFQPKKSLVFVWFSGDRIVLTQRIDIAALEHLLADPHALTEPARHVESAQVLVTCFPSGTWVEGSQLLGFVPNLAAHGISVLDVLIVDSDSWRSVMCRDHCCTQGPRPIEADVRDRVAADFILDGVVVLGDRDQLLDEVARDDELVARVRDNWILDADYPDLVRRCIRRWQQTNGRIRNRDLVAHLAVLQDVPARDVLIWHLAQLEPTRLRYAAELFRMAVRAAPDLHVTPIATLAGIAAWLTGDGARALVALDRGLAADPHYVLAHMVQTAISAGIPPSQWRAMVQQVPVDQICPRAFQENPL